MNLILKAGKAVFKKKIHVALMLSLLLLTSIALVGCSASVRNESVTTGTGGLPGTQAPSPFEPGVLFDENIVVSLYERAMPAVVKVTVRVDAASSTIRSFGTPQQQGQGSGFIIDTEGHILTNNHVIENSSDLRITLHDGNVYSAKVLGTDQANDIAILQVDPTKINGVKPLPLGDSDRIKPGQMAVAFGSPYGLEGSVTVGIISGVKRSIPSAVQRQITNVIQTDAAINPGNSGGPLMNSKGEVVGINTAIEVTANSIGYAIPINTAKARLPLLLKGEKVKSPWLGIQGTAVTPDLASKLGLNVTSGVYIIGVTADGPAQKAGLKESGRNSQNEPAAGGDIVTAVDGVKVATVDDLISYFNSKKPGDEVTLTVIRDGKQVIVKAMLGEWPEGKIIVQ